MCSRNLGIAGIDVLDADQARSAGGGDELEIGGIGIDSAASRIGDHARVADRVRDALEKGVASLPWTDADDAREQPEEDDEAKERQNGPARQKPDGHRPAQEPRNAARCQGQDHGQDQRKDRPALSGAVQRTSLDLGAFDARVAHRDRNFPIPRNRPSISD